jgi:hypothetical protein
VGDFEEYTYTGEHFYWGGEDHEDLYCMCGTPHPVQIFNEALPGVAIRKCSQCGAVAILDDGADFNNSWDIVANY